MLDSGDEGTIEGSFGKGGKFKVNFSGGLLKVDLHTLARQRYLIRCFTKTDCEHLIDKNGMLTMYALQPAPRLGWSGGR